MNIENFYSLYIKANRVTIDSRKIQEGDLFFAFSGANFNAATVAADAIKSGAVAVFVEDKTYEDAPNNIYWVPSVLELLQDLSVYHRRHITIPVIALTGSNGKTTTKELISAVLAQKFNVQYTQGNLNNHIGVPLTLLSIKKEHEIAVVEMGANHQQEISALCRYALPDFGYITNFGKAHLEGFGGYEGVIKGKSELYDYLINNGKTIVVNESDSVQNEKTKYYKNKITFGKQDSDYYFEQFSERNFTGICYKNENVLSHLTGAYNFTNLCAAVAVGLHFKIEFSKIKEAIEGYTPNNMRSQVVQKQGRTLVLDTYNANPSSMAASLQNFNHFAGTKTVIMGDMLELGEESEKEHAEILNLAKSLHFDKIITVGEIFSKVNMHHAFESVDQLSSYLKNKPLAEENILLKGSRGIALEKVIDFL